MSDHVLQTLQRLVQDVIAPDVRELKVRLSALEKSVDERFTSLERQSEAQYKGILAAVGESKAQSELEHVRTIAALSERVAALEARRQ